MKYAIFSLLIISMFGVFNIAFSQTSASTQTVINMELIPELPRPNETVQVSLTSFATDLNSANITWKINGKTQKSGIGEKNFNFIMGGMNTKTIIDVSIRTSEGETINKNLVLKASDVDLIWQTKSFVPPFYKGKAMFSHQNEITFIAIPHITGSNGNEISTKNLIYKWKKNGSVVEEVSGYGKNIYTLVGSIISRPLNIEVEVSTTNKEGVGYGSTYLEPKEPSIIIYEKSPLYGIKFQEAILGEASLDNSKEVTVVGMPFFFGTRNSTAQELVYKWSINGRSIGNDPSASNQVFRQKEGTSGYSKISLSIENISKILQSATSNFNLRFEE